MTELSRRAVLSTTGRAAVATLSLGGVAVASTAEPDPIFSALDAFRKGQRLSLDLYTELDEAEATAKRHTGEPRPWRLIRWRHYSAIGGSELADRREEFLRDWAKGDPTLTMIVEAEYEDAKEREQAARAAGVDWDTKNGLTDLRERYHRTEGDVNTAVRRLSETEPTTVAGCAALVQAVAEEIEGGEMAWFEPGLRNAARALTRLTGGQANA